MANSTPQQFVPEVVDKVRPFIENGMDLREIQNKTSVPLNVIARIRTQSEEFGWDQIVASEQSYDDFVEEDADESEVEDPEADIVSDVTAAPDQSFGGEPAAVSENDQSSVAATAAEAIQDAVEGQERRKPGARGHKEPNRASHSAQKRARRRKKGGDPLLGRRRLLVKDSALDKDQFVYRWALDRSGRMYEMTQLDDWDPVDDAHIHEGQGGNVTAIAGKNDYNADKMVLLRKRREYHEEDQRDKELAQRELEQQIQGGQTDTSRGPDQLVEALKSGEIDANATYVPKGERISIGKVSEAA